MDDSQENIFSGLSQHEENPPENLFNKIVGGIRMENAENLDNQLQSLKDFSIIPPVNLYEQIRKKTTSKENAVVFFLTKYRAVAAIFIIGLITIIAIYQFQPNNKTPDEIVSKEIIPVIPTIDSAITKPGKNNYLVNKPENKKDKRNKITLYKPTPGIQEISFIDNDLITSLTECSNCNFAAFFSGKKKIVVTINPYSSITVTEKMGSFMKSLYSTNRRNKPTVKAKKARKTLQKWKKADVDYFDSSTIKSSLDPLDLTEYIIDNK